MLLAAVCCWLWMCAQGHDHEHLPLTPDQFASHSPAEVRYDLSAQFLPDSGYVRGMLDASLTNRSGKVIDEFYLSCSAVPTIDSVLYRGTPIDLETIDSAGGDYRIVPPQPLLVGETTHFLVSFKTPILDAYPSPNGLTVLRNWFPRLLRPIRTQDPAHEGRGALPDDPYRCDIRATLRVDSVYSLVIAGELLNEKQYVGLAPNPEPGEIQIDVAGKHQTPWGGKTFTQHFPSGYKRYQVRHDGAMGLPLVIGRGLVQDRAAVDGLMLNLFRPPTVSDALSREVLSESQKLAEVLTDWLGEPGYPVCNMVVGTNDEIHSLDPSLLILTRPGIVGHGVMLDAVAAMTGLWLDRQSDCHLDNNDIQLLKCYMTATLLAGSTLYPRHIGTEILESGPLSNLHITNRICGLHAASFVVGHEVFWSVIRNWLAETPGEHSQITRLDSAFDGSLAHVCDDLSLAALSVTLDFGADAASPSCWRLYNHGDLALPLEIAYIIGHGDTLIDTILVSETQTSHGGQDISLPRGMTIRTIIVDPYFRYNDVDRRDNILHFIPSRQRHFPPEDVFPLYNRR